MKEHAIHTADLLALESTTYESIASTRAGPWELMDPHTLDAHQLRKEAGDAAVVALERFAQALHAAGKSYGAGEIERMIPSISVWATCI